MSERRAVGFRCGAVLCGACALLALGCGDDYVVYDDAGPSDAANARKSSRDRPAATHATSRFSRPSTAMSGRRPISHSSRSGAVPLTLMSPAWIASR